MDIKKFWKSEIKKHGFKQGKGGRMVKDYGDAVGWAHIYQSRFAKWFFIDAGTFVKDVPTGWSGTHLEARIGDDVVPREWKLEDALYLENSMEEHDRELALVRAAEFLTNLMDNVWSDKEWLIQQARLPYNPNVRILQSLVKYVAELDKSEET